jgi:hypothetical protein
LLHDNESTPEKKDSNTLSAFLQLTVSESVTTTTATKTTTTKTKTSSSSSHRIKEQRGNKNVKNLQLITIEAEKSLSLSTLLSEPKISTIELVVLNNVHYHNKRANKNRLTFA